MGRFVLEGGAEDKVESGKVDGAVVEAFSRMGDRVSGGLTGADIGAVTGTSEDGERFGE